MLSFDEDDFYCNFYQDGKDFSFFKISSGKKRYGQAKAKLAAKLELLSELAEEPARQELLEVLANAKEVIFASDLLKKFCQVFGIHNALTSFDYLDRGEREDLDMPCQLQRLPES